MTLKSLRTKALATLINRDKVAINCNDEGYRLTRKMKGNIVLDRSLKCLLGIQAEHWNEKFNVIGV